MAVFDTFFITAIGLGVIFSTLYIFHIKHKENMAMIMKGMKPPFSPEERRDTWGLLLTGIGASLAISGVFDLVKNPWVAGGMMLVSFGTALIISHHLTEVKRKR